jgi:3',5'-cyclic AMP phosphodiesterase CpdA
MADKVTLVGQITDLHILAEREPAYRVADTCAALEALEAYLFGLSPPLDALVMTGDLADRGEAGAYAFIAALFARWTVPVFALPGNHDSKGELRSGLGRLCPARGGADLSFSARLGDLRLVMLDTALEGRHGGNLGPAALSFLNDELSDPQGSHVIVFGHHPPFVSGLGAMDEPFAGRDRLLSALSRHPRDLTLASGHLHRPMATRLRLGGPGQILASVAPPASMPIDLDLSPQGGQRFSLGAPGFAVHRLGQGRLVTHFGSVPGAFPVSGPHAFS